METKPGRVKPSQPGGVRDYLPREMIDRLRMLDTIERVYQRFGFDPLETPGLERREVLTGNDEQFRMSIFNARRSGARDITGGGDDNALRFDLTVPLARVVAANLDTLQLPFKRYQRGVVWRGEKPQAGRFCEFMQFDADIVGSATALADAEIIALMYQTMVALGFARFCIRVNNRKILNGLPIYAGFDPAKLTDVLRVFDKFDRDGPDAVSRMLRQSPPHDRSHGEEEEGLELGEIASDRLMEFIRLSADSPIELLGRLTVLFAGNDIAEQGIIELGQITNALKVMGIPDANWLIDLSVARGLGYYTGPVFETVLTDLPDIGSVFSGGRYDDLVNRFTDATLPATGASIGVDRLFYAMEKLGFVRSKPTVVQALVTIFDTNLTNEYLALTSELRKAGIHAALYLGEGRTLTAQVSYAAAQEIPAVIIMGRDELGRGTVQVKDMAARSQAEVARDQFVRAVQAIIA